LAEHRLALALPALEFVPQLLDARLVQRVRGTRDLPREVPRRRDAARIGFVLTRGMRWGPFERLRGLRAVLPEANGITRIIARVCK
jgi:hypothetical protein